jgi:hypothetical protein
MPGRQRAGEPPGDGWDQPESAYPADRMQEAAETAAAMAAETERTGGLGRPGRPVNRRSPFFVGMAGAAGVAVTYGIAKLVIKAGSVLILIGMAFFVAAGLEPVVSWLSPAAGGPGVSCCLAY